jgi:hypothetical protein
MMDESDLRRRFAQLREADQERAPGFAHIYGRARAQGRARARQSWRGMLRVRPLVIGAAAAVAIAAIGLTYSRSVSSSAVAPEIVTWRAPTDALLRTPGSELLTAMPALGASVLDKMIPTLSEKGA